MGPGNGFLFHKILLFGCLFWIYASALFLDLLGLFKRFFLRVQEDENSEKRSSSHTAICSPMKPEAVFDEAKTNDFDFYGAGNDDEEGAPKFFVKFKFQTYEEYTKINRGNMELVPSTSTSKYEFRSRNYLGSFVQEPKDVSFTAEELIEGSANQSSGEVIVDEEEKDRCKDNLSKEEENENGTIGEDALGDVDFLSEEDFIAKDFESDLDSIASSSENMFIGQSVAFTSEEGFLSDRDFVEASEKGELNESDDEDSETDEIEEITDYNANVSRTQQLVGQAQDNVAASSVNDSKDMHSADSNGLETLWEHQDLIEQLRMELKKVKAIGLPTIFEESESPKLMEDLKPWKIDDKFHHTDTMSELHKFYISYGELMRKYDILIYQKMYTIGFLQSKDPLKSSPGLNFSPPGITSILSNNFLLRKQKRSEFDPMKKFTRELHSDLEVYYVGQLCLSWEILHWQYEKSLELWRSDHYGIRSYSEVSRELQHFQVLMQRFIENEPFEGPRVQNYIKNRCVLRNLIQVPAIREDRKTDKKARMKRKDGITSHMLVEIMEESIRIFWRFVRADKDATFVTRRSRTGAQIQPQDTLYLELLAEVRSDLQKKEKKLKERLRSGNCILRKFQKQQDNSDQVLYFFSQVDMKLVARVLNMTKLTTDQLHWCRNKLDNINFVSRKIHVQPAFLVFPC